MVAQLVDVTVREKPTFFFFEDIIDEMVFNQQNYSYIQKFAKVIVTSRYTTVIKLKWQTRISRLSTANSSYNAPESIYELLINS